MKYKQEFVKFLLSAEVLQFGNFTAKSGRKTPYFINAGKFKTGAQISELGKYYALCYQEKYGNASKVLYGPAYKGIPIAVATAIALSQQGVDVPYFYNRKEEKDHGERGIFVGYLPDPKDEIVIVEDVITAGTAIHENIRYLQNLNKIKISSAIIMVDRMERGQGNKSAISELEIAYGFPIYPIITINDIMEHLYMLQDANPANQLCQYIEAMIEYRSEFGIQQL